MSLCIIFKLPAKLFLSLYFSTLKNFSIVEAFFWRCTVSICVPFHGDGQTKAEVETLLAV
jgi:hypothetical protein